MRLVAAAALTLVVAVVPACGSSKSDPAAYCKGLRQTASIIANPLVRNRATFLEALSPESPYFDITTPLALLEAKVKLQSPAGKRTLSIRDYLEAATKGLKKGEIPTAIEFSTDRCRQ